MSVDRFDLFGAPLRVSTLDDLGPLVPEAAARLVDESRRTPGIARSNVGGWHSVPDLTLRRESPIAPVMQRLVAEVDRTVKELAHARGVADRFAHGYGVHAWAMVLGAGDYVTPHCHAEAHLSGAFYVDAGDEPPDDRPSGRIVFRNPVAGAAMVPGLDLFPGEFSVQPRTGMLILFPGYLPHYVHPYRGARPRVCISLNVRIEPRRRPPAG